MHLRHLYYTLSLQGSEITVKEETEKLQEPDVVKDYMETVLQTHIACMFGHIYSERSNCDSMHAVPACTYGLIVSIAIVAACTLSA